MTGNHLRPVGPDEAAEPLDEPQAAADVARRLLVEAESHIREPGTGHVYADQTGALATIALGWATLALTEPPQ